MTANRTSGSRCPSRWGQAIVPYLVALCRVGALLGAWLLLAATAQAQTGTVRGFVTDRADGEPLLGVNVVLERAGSLLLGATTNGDGIYAISSVPPGRYQLRASFIGYETFVDSVTVRASERVHVNIALGTSQTELEGVTVEAEDIAGAGRLVAGAHTLHPQDIQRVPGPDVTKDLAMYLTTLPGFVTLGDRGGQLFIRGGEPSHNLVLLDGMYVYQPFHVLGFYSAFPSSVISRANVHAASYGSPFTGRLASVIDIHSRDGNKHSYAGSASVSPFVSAVHVEGPLVQDEVSFIGSVRQSVLEYGAEHYVAQELPYHFGDVFGKIHARIGKYHQLSATALYTYDRSTLGARSTDEVFDEIRWSNRAVGLRYIVMPPSLPFMGEILLSLSHMRTELGRPEAPVRYSQIDGFNYAVNMTHFFRHGEWKWGLFWRVPEVTSMLGGLYQDTVFGSGRRYKSGIYLEPDFYLSEALHLRFSLIAQLFPEQRNPSFVEPRLRLTWTRGAHELSAAAGLYHQEIFGLNDRRDATNLFTAWRGAPRENLSRAVHVLAGYAVSPSPWLNVAAEGYYKRLSNLYISEWTAFPRFTTNLHRASGNVAGLDLRVELQRKRFYGYVSYGLSSVRYRSEEPAVALWYGEESLAFRPPHDSRHQINTLARLTLFGFDLSARWSFNSGRPFNRIYGFDGFVFMNGVQDLFTVDDEQRVIYERPFQGILPTYHRLDVSLERTFDLGRAELTAQAGAINVYDRRNIFALDIFTQRRTDQLPIVPTFGLEVTFR